MLHRPGCLHLWLSWGHLGDFERGVNVELRLAGASVRKTSQLICWFFTINRVWHDVWHGTPRERHNQQSTTVWWKRILHDRDIRESIWSARPSRLQINWLNFNLGREQPVSSKKVRWELHRAEYPSLVAVSNSLITSGNACLHVQWCKEHRQWTTEQWRIVIWSDESSSTMFSTNRRVHLWRKPK